MADHFSIAEKYSFRTKRLKVKSWKHQIMYPSNERKFANQILQIMTPKVTKSLPDDWQKIDSLDKANHWIRERDEESEFLTIELSSETKIIGFLFLYEATTSNNMIDLRLGYLLSETVWGNGLGSELIKGLVDCCENNLRIKSISGGVEIENVGSIKVLEKNGFSPVQSNHQPKDLIFLERKFDH
jgi:[ribosomal protein S5]-alanine N-acetyltransferase